MKIKTADLIGPALDWAVAKCEGLNSVAACYLNGEGQLMYLEEASWPTWEPSTNWSQGGPIIEQELLCVNPDTPRNQWMAITNSAEIVQFGPTALIAAMRCFVASRLGDEVDVPDELV